MAVAVCLVLAACSGAGVTTGYTDPVRLGADRWAGVIGAWKKFGGPVCVVDAGTAITVDAVDAEGELDFLCQDTRSAIWSGGWHTAAGFLERVHARLGEELGPDTQFILTGGDGPRLGNMLPGKFTPCPELVILGLAVVAGEKP